MDEFEDPEIANYLKELERLSQEVQEEKKAKREKSAASINNLNKNETVTSNTDVSNQIGPQIPINSKPKPLETQVISKAPVKALSNSNIPYPGGYSVGSAIPFEIRKNVGQIPDISEVPLPVGYTKNNTIQSYAPEIPSPFVTPILPLPTPIRKPTQTKETKSKVPGEVIAHVRKKGEFEWDDPSLNDWDTSEYFHLIKYDICRLIINKLY